MKTFLVQAPLWGLQPPLAITSLGKYLADRGHDVTAYDLNINLYHRRAKEYAYAFTADQCGLWVDPGFSSKVLEAHREFITSDFIRPIAAAERPVVGFSINICSIYPSLILAEWIKQANPSAFIVFGGELFSVDQNWPRISVESGWVDAVITGDGEHTLAELLQFLHEKRDLSDCKGLHIMAGGQVRFTGARRPINLDESAFSDYSLLHYDDYSFDGICDRNDIIFMASRGCVRNCTFCGYRVPWPGFRAMSGERIFAEIKYQEKRLGKVNQIKFYDLLMNGDMRKLVKLCDLLIADSGHKHIWRDINCVIRPEMTPEVCLKMFQAGCRDVTFGLESGSQRVLDLMRKQATPETAEVVLKNMTEAGIHTLGNFMFGFPGETEEDFQETMRFLSRIHKNLHNCYPSYTFTIIEPASPLAWERDAFQVTGDHSLYWETTDGTNNYPLRLDRYRRFREYAKELGVNVRDGVETSLDMWISLCLAEYHEHKKDFKAALEQYQKYLTQDPYNERVVAKVSYCRSQLSPRTAGSVDPTIVGLPR
jgi:radical SAM superfamily enzyme YgiQ (UPF0313 family)